MLELAYEVDNRGGAVRLGAPTAETAQLALLPGGPPAPVATGARGRFVVRLRADCRTLRSSLGRDVGLRLPVTTATGAIRSLPVPLDPSVLTGLADQACGLAPATDFVSVRVLGPVRTTPAGVVFWLAARNTSLRYADVAALTAPGLQLLSRDELPVSLPPGRTITLRVTMSVRACALVATATSAQQADALGPAELAVDVQDPGGASASLPIELLPGQPSHTQWLSYIARTCAGR